MGEQWLPTAGILLAAFLVASASALPLISAHEEDPDQPPSAPGSPARHDSRVPPGFLPNISDSLVSVQWESKAPGMGAGALSPEPAPLGHPRASGRATTDPASSVLTVSVVRMTPKSNLASPGAESTEKTLSPGSLESDDTLSPARGSGKKCGKASGFCVTIPAPASTAVNTVTPRPIWLPSRALVTSTTSVPRSGHRHSPWHPFILSAQNSSARREGHSKPKASSTVTLTPRAPLGRPPFDWMVNTLAATKPLPSVALGKSDWTSLSVTMGSGSSGDSAASSLNSGPRGASTLQLPSVTPPRPLSPSLSPRPSPALSLFTSLPQSSFLDPVSSLITGTSDSPDPSVPAFMPSTTDLPLKISSLVPVLPPLMAHQPTTLQGTVHSWPGDPSSPAPITTLSLQHPSSLLYTPPSSSSGSPSIPGGADPTQTSVLSHHGQDVPFQDLNSLNPGPNHVTHSVTFRIAIEGFSAATWNLKRLELKWLREFVRYRLQLIYKEAFPSFKSISTLLLQPGSPDVNASLVFGQPGLSACEVLWALYRKVRASRWLLGHLPLAENSLASDGFYLTDLALETISISFTVTSPFLPQLLLPGSHPFVLLEKQILQLVTPEVSVFYKVHPQQGPLLLFSNANQWVSVYMEYKFQNPLPTHLEGLANHLAHHITDPILQKSTIVANGEKAKLTSLEIQLLIWDHPFTMALENKTSPESQELRRLLTKWLTSVLNSLQNFGQVVVEDFHSLKPMMTPPARLEPLIAKVHAAFWGAAPAQTHFQACVSQALRFLQEVEGLQAEMVTSHHGTPSSGASSHPSYVLVPSLLWSLVSLSL